VGTEVGVTIFCQHECVGFRSITKLATVCHPHCFLEFRGDTESLFLVLRLLAGGRFRASALGKITGTVIEFEVFAQVWIDYLYLDATV
jgi:hypothetical protein